MQWRGSMTSGGASLCPFSWLAPLLLAAALFVPMVAGSEENPEVGVFSEVDEIIVRASRREVPVVEVAASVSVVGLEEIQLARPQLTLGESLAQVPGVFAQNRDNFSQDLRISIRGFGARARFGLRGVKLLIDGFPASLPDGQGQVDTLQLSTTGRIEVLRGPSGSLYGSAAGGVIRVESEPVSAQATMAGRVGFGSDGYRSYELKSSGYAGPVGLLVGLSRQQMGGYREHSRMESNVMNSRAYWAIDDQSELMGLLNVVHAPVAEDPGGLTALQRGADRKQAAARNLEFDVGEKLNQVTGGLRYRRNWDSANETTLAAWTAWRGFDNNLPFNGDCGPGRPPGTAGELDRIFGGASAQHVLSSDILERGNTLLVGFDVEMQRDDRSRRCNFGGGSLGAYTLDQEEDVTSLRAFFHDEFQLREDLALSFSLGFDALRYEVSDRLPVSGGNPNDSGRLDFSEWSPAASLRWSPDSALSLYTRVSTSFEPPTTTELRVEGGGGGFNRDLEAQSALNFEVGLKGMVPGRLRYELVAYRIWTRDELLPYQDPNAPGGETYFRNAGRTKRRGVEAMLEYEFIPGLIASAAYTYSSAEFVDYVVSGQDLKGKQIPGVPEQHLYAELRYIHSSGFFAALEGRYVGAFWADDANTVQTDAYGLLDLRLGWRGEIGSWKLAPYLALANLTDSVYDDNVRLNANGGYFEPAAGFAVQGGLSLSYLFDGP